jgi:signal transduction histidine kinase
VLRLAEGDAAPKIWLSGAHVRVTGVCEVGSLDHRAKVGAGTLEPKFFQILLRSPADVVVLRLPSWWNAEHVAWVTGGVAATFLAIIGIVFWIARHRLREQAAEQLKAETEFAAILNERNRMAREIHDTMSQGLSAISMQLEVVKRQLPKESQVRESLEVARSLTRTSMTAARKAIWNARSQDLEDGDLATALGDVLRHLTEGTETMGELRVTGQMRRFAPVTENDLLRIGQEAITNAAKYAQAKNILVTLDFGERQFCMYVKDDGKGFDVQAPPPGEGGFGLKAMRERAAQLHAEFSITSEPGRGTVVTVIQPLSQ